LGKEWISASKRFLLPFEVVRKKFRGKFMAHINKALNNGELELPNGMRPQQFKNLLNKLGRKEWNVHLKETYSYDEGVLTYLARYLRGGPISNRRIFSIKDGKVTFNYGREKVSQMTLPLDRFIARYLQHVPLPNAVRVRSYGIYHHSCKGHLELCRQLLGQPPVEDIGFQDWQTLYHDQVEKHPGRCPVCGKRLTSLEILPPVNPCLPIAVNEEPHIPYDKAA
jgi:hypothetical protein